MKKLLVLFLLLALPCYGQQTAWEYIGNGSDVLHAQLKTGPSDELLARMNVGIVGAGITAGDCTCTGTGDWETGIVERFEIGADDFCTNDTGGADWAIVETGGGVVNTYNSTQSKSCGHSLSVADDSDAASEDAYVVADITDSDNFSVDFWVYIDNFTSWANTNYVNFVNVQGPNNHIRAYSDGTDVKFQMTFGSEDTANFAMAAATWYRLHLDYNRNGLTLVYIYNAANSLLDTIGAGTTSDTAATSIRFGIPYQTTANAAQFTVYFDDITFDVNGD